MKKLILNENKLNVLLEYAGFVNVFSYLIDHIYNISYEKVEKLIKSVVKNRFQRTPQDIFQEFEDSDYVSLDEPLKDWIIPQHHLQRVNIKDIKQVTVKYMIDDNIDGGFDNKSVSINENGFVNNLTIVINIKTMFFNGKGYKNTLQHELTHAYEMIQRHKKNGGEKTNMNFNNKYYKQEKGVVDGMSYYFSKVEMNAAISETAYLLRQKNAQTEQDCWNIINDENSYAFKYLAALNKIYEGLRTNINYTYTVIEFLKMNPQHIDMFPSVRNNNVASYQRRLLRVAEHKINYFKQKLNKIVKVYIQRKSGVK